MRSGGSAQEQLLAEAPRTEAFLEKGDRTRPGADDEDGAAQRPRQARQVHDVVRQGLRERRCSPVWRSIDWRGRAPASSAGAATSASLIHAAIERTDSDHLEIRIRRRPKSPEGRRDARSLERPRLEERFEQESDSGSRRAPSDISRTPGDHAVRTKGRAFAGPLHDRMRFGRWQGLTRRGRRSPRCKRSRRRPEGQGAMSPHRGGSQDKLTMRCCRGWQRREGGPAKDRERCGSRRASDDVLGGSRWAARAAARRWRRRGQAAARGARWRKGKIPTEERKVFQRVRLSSRGALREGDRKGRCP